MLLVADIWYSQVLKTTSMITVTVAEKSYINGLKQKEIRSLYTALEQRTISELIVD